MRALLALALLPCLATADTLEFADGRVLKNCYVRDEGVRFAVWKSLDEVGRPPTYYPRAMVKSFKLERGPEWDKKPALPDLSVTFIEITPKLAGLHGRVDYDMWGRPKPSGGTKIKDLGELNYLQPEQAVKDLKLSYSPGEELTLTANVKNVGFKAASGFAYEWLLDGKQIGKGVARAGLKEMDTAQFQQKIKWQAGRHTLQFKITPAGPEISTNNDQATDPLWGWGLVYVVHNGRANAWHQFRSGFGTFSFEDWYRWHIDLMNLLFESSVWPSAPMGIIARVRLDRIVYTDGDVGQAQAALVQPDGIRYDQGAWVWVNEEDAKKQWVAPSLEWRNSTEWSLPHELGHQLGLTDLYGLDFPGSENHKWPDTGEMVGHFQRYPNQMMHWHGPHLWGELDAGYLNRSWDKPRGHFGDQYFGMPDESWIRVTDVNGEPVRGANVEVFQRGATPIPSAATAPQRGSRWAEVKEDGSFPQAVAKDWVIAGQTDADGKMFLPNRPVKPVRTLNGFERKPNPFGNINVVGERGLLLVKVALKSDSSNPAYFWLEAFDFNVAYLRGEKSFTIPLQTPFGSVDSPEEPSSVAARKLDENNAQITWQISQSAEPNYLRHVTGFRIFRRQTSDGLEARPWTPVATLGRDARSANIDLRQFPDDNYWNSRTVRFAVASIGYNGKLSGLVSAVLK